MNELTPTELDVQQLANELSESLSAKYGPILGSSSLVKALGYPSSGSFYQALSRGTVPVPVFRIDNRRGSFALTRDVALWLSKKRAQAIQQQNEIQDAS